MEGQILEVWRKTEMKLRNLVVWNENINEQPEERKETKNKRGKRNRDQEKIDCGQYRSILLRARKEPGILNPAVLRLMQNIHEASCCFILGCRSIFNTLLNPEIWEAVLIILSQVVTIAVTTILMIQKVYTGGAKSQQKLTGDSHQKLMLENL